MLPFLCTIPFLNIEFHHTQSQNMPRTALLKEYYLRSYGLIGFGTDEAGMHHGWELFVCSLITLILRLLVGENTVAIAY